jgi:SAM-dependent methyltransferase
MNSRKETENKVLAVYQKVNPSTYYIENSEEEYRIRAQYIRDLFQKRLNFPPKMFQDADMIEFGSGTGEHSYFFLQYGAKGTFVEMNELSIARSKSIFEHFNVPKTQYQHIHQSIYDYSSDKQFDIAVCMSVLHHLEHKETAFDLMAAKVRQGGYFILAVGNNAGLFQVNLQRLIVNQLAGTDEAKIYEIADQLFDEHISRSQKYGRRSREAIIYDSYVNPKIDGLGVGEVLNLYKKNGFELYSAWPPIIPTFFSDPPNREQLDYPSYPETLGLPELIYTAHREDDKMLLGDVEQNVGDSMKELRKLIQSIREVTPDKKVNLGELKSNISLTIDSMNTFYNPYSKYVDQLVCMLNEARHVMEVVGTGDVDRIKSQLLECKYLFRGTNGIGINWYIGHKPLPNL